MDYTIAHILTPLLYENEYKWTKATGQAVSLEHIKVSRYTILMSMEHMNLTNKIYVVVTTHQPPL